MKQLQAMAFEMRQELEDGNLDRLGPMLRAAFESKKLMNPHVSEGTRIEHLLAVAADAGASGGKICGAGGGGYLLLACPPTASPRSGGARGARRPVRGVRVPLPRGRGARRRSRVETLVSRRFVLLDRDGTINEEIGYVLRPDELRLIPGAETPFASSEGSGSGSSS